MYLSEFLASEDDIDNEYLLREQKNLLRRELSLMSGNYRKAVVMHYFDGMSCEEIGIALGKSSGTVKWWLHDAREAIEKGINKMREYGEKSYRPGRLHMSFTGTPGLNREPITCVQRKSTQNILLAAYKKPMTITELCEELGISAPYIEDEVQYLVDNQLMCEVGKSRYQTDFVILPGNSPEDGNLIYSTAFPEYYNKLIAFLESKKDILTEPRFNTAGFEWNRLLWVYIHIISNIAVDEYRFGENISVTYDNIPLRPNGGKWIALGYDFSSKPDSEQKWMEYSSYDGPVHKPDYGWVQGFFHTWSGSSRIFFDTPDDVFFLCRDIINGEKPIENLTEDEKYLFSIALEKKLFVKSGDGFRHNYYFIGREERCEIEEMGREFYGEVSDIIKKAYKVVLDKELSLIPKHLHWQGNHVANYLNYFITCSFYDAYNSGKLSTPDENNREWLSLFATE